MDANKKVQQVLTYLADAAAAAAGSVSDVMHTAGHKVGDTYDSIKLNLELSRLLDEQRKLFSDAGRTLYLIRSGGYAAAAETAAGEMLDAQQTVERLLFLADQKQQEIDIVTERLGRLNGSRVCAVCGHVSDAKSAFCPGCGNRLER